MTQPPRPASAGEGARLEWPVLADATAAGLSVLLPIPFADLALEAVFRRRMPAAIARHRGVALPPELARELGRGGEPWLSVHGCLTAPITLTVYVLKRISRKLFYVLTIKEATEQLSAYWHRAWLIDHLVRSGRLGGADVATVAAFRATLERVETRPLHGAARAVIGTARHHLGVLRRARHGDAAAETAAEEAALRGHWADARAHLERVVATFEQLAPPGPDATPGA